MARKIIFLSEIFFISVAYFCWESYLMLHIILYLLYYIHYTYILNSEVYQTLLK